MGQVLVIILLFCVLFMSKSIPRLMRSLGRGVGGGYEVKVGEVVRLKIEASSTPCNRQDLVERVERIGARLAAKAKRQSIPYRFRVLEDPAPNAFAIPGGCVYITRSLVDLCDAEPASGADDRLAGVLGHEIAHIELRHAAHQLAARAAVKTGVMILARGRAALLRRASGHLEELLTKGYGRQREHEADATGQALATGAGFRGDGLAELLGMLAAASRGEGTSAWKLPTYFDTHPSLESRVQRLRGGGRD